MLFGRPGGRPAWIRVTNSLLMLLGVGLALYVGVSTWSGAGVGLVYILVLLALGPAFLFNLVLILRRRRSGRAPERADLAPAGTSLLTALAGERSLPAGDRLSGAVDSQIAFMESLVARILAGEQVDLALALATAEGWAGSPLQIQTVQFLNSART